MKSFKQHLTEIGLFWPLVGELLGAGTLTVAFRKKLENKAAEDAKKKAIGDYVLKQRKQQETMRK